MTALSDAGTLSFGPGERGWTSQYPPTRDGINVGVIILCVLLPAASVLIELFGGWCAQVMFDPFPTPWHGALALCVPVFNAWAYWLTRRTTSSRYVGARFLAGIAAGVGVYFTIEFLPALPLGLIGIMALGLGLLVFGPLCGLIGSIHGIRLAIKRSRASGVVGRRGFPYALAGMAIPLMILCGAEVKGWYTLHQLRVVSSHPERSADVVRTLRSWGDRRTMVDACVGTRGRGGVDSFPNGWDLLNGREAGQTSNAWETFYRVTGHMADDPAVAGWRSDGWFDWDGFRDERVERQLRGGDLVGQEVRGLNLSQSLMTGAIHNDAAIGYVEWTLTFANSTANDQEVRCRIALPEGGVVSRVTLWINGKECEAAYGPVGRVKSAYQSVAVVQRRDPVLVTHCGIDQVRLQCFPVPAGGTMRTRIGISIPLRLTSAVSEQMALPRFTERNFAVGNPDTHLHQLVIDAAQPLHADPSAGLHVRPPQSDDAGWLLAGGVNDELLSERLLIRADRRPARTTMWGENPFDPASPFIVQTIRAASSSPPSEVTLVVDGSYAMAKPWTAVCDAVALLPSDTRLRCLLTLDETLRCGDGLVSPAKAAAFLRMHEPVGGQDAVDTLRKAMEQTAPDGIILWLHGPQPEVSEIAPLVMTTGWKSVTAIQAAPGANAVAEALATAGRLATPPTGDTLQQTIAGWAESTLRAGPVWIADRSSQREPPQLGDDAHKTNINLARLWAAERVMEVLKQGGADALYRAEDLAVRHQLVTAVSGAVVLETQQQYEDHGLSPVKAVPLPPAVWAGLATLPLVVLARRAMTRRSRAVGHV